MITKMFSLFDSKAAMYSTPFFMLNQGSAIRAFVDLVNDPSTMVHKHPEDFSLFMLAEFDDSTGVIECLKPVNLGNAASYKKPTPKDYFETPLSLPKVNSVIEEAVR